MVFVEDNHDKLARGANIHEGGQSNVKQSFLRPEKDRFEGVSPELSAFCMSKDLRLLFVASAQADASVFVWEITTNTQLC
jgi:hypothetical protein